MRKLTLGTLIIVIGLPLVMFLTAMVQAACVPMDVGPSLF